MIITEYLQRAACRALPPLAEGTDYNAPVEAVPAASSLGLTRQERSGVLASIDFGEDDEDPSTRSVGVLEQVRDNDLLTKKNISNHGVKYITNFILTFQCVTFPVILMLFLPIEITIMHDTKRSECHKIINKLF